MGTRLITIQDDPAFSRPYTDYDGALGLTKREYFAAMALQGSIASVNVCDWMISDHAVFAVDAADALIEALNKETQ